VIADLSGETLEAALRGGLDLLKVSDEDLIRDGLLASRGLGATLASARDLQLRGATWVLVTRAEEPALLLTEDEELLVEGPHLAPIDQHGAGDSVFAGVGVALGAGLPLKRAIQFGVAAGALNVARHGLGTGHVREVARLAGKVRLYPVKRESADRKESSGASLLPGR
jgi:1-phosphofructokinase